MRPISAPAVQLCALSLFGLAACGGGGGNSGPSISVSPSSLSFSAANPNAAVPASQTVTLTVNGAVSGTLYVRVVVTGPAVSSVSNVTVTSATQGQAAVTPASPASLGTGTHASVITIVACTTDIDCSGPQLGGSPKTINVTYQIGSLPPPPDGVAPRVGTANMAGEIVIRGSGFTPATSVSFGDTPATTFSVLSGTEIHATYPGLAAGTYAVQLQGSAGAIPFSESLVIVNAPGYAGTTLAFPSAPQEVRGFVYDAERQALLAGVGFSTGSANQILRYAFSGGAWQQTPDSATHADLRDLALSLNGSRLLAISDASMAQVDPVTLGVVTTTAKPPSFDSGEYLKGVVVANDGKAVVTTGYKLGSGHTRLFLYSSRQSAFSLPGVSGGFNSFYYALAGTGSNGATVAIIESGLTSATPFYRYVASSGILSATSFQIDHHNPDPHQNTNLPAFDRAGSRMVVASFGPTYRVYDASFTRLGSLPSSTTAAYAVAPDASRAYTLDLDTGVCRVRAFALIATPGSTDLLTEIVAGFPIPITDCPAGTSNSNVKMLVSPAGDTLFIAGNLRIAVVPLP